MILKVHQFQLLWKGLCNQMGTKTHNFSHGGKKINITKNIKFKSDISFQTMYHEYDNI